MLSGLHPKSSSSFLKAFDSDLTALYSCILEFQARAICYLWKHSITRLFSDAFKQNGWTELLKTVKDTENTIGTYAAIIRDSDIAIRLEKIQTQQERSSEWDRLSNRDVRVKQFLNMLYTSNYRDGKNRNHNRVEGTCEWFTNHPLFHHWNESRKSSLLWVSADPGCGKSVLVKHLVDHILPTTSKRSTCYFFFKDDFTDQKSAANALCAILRQIFLAKPHLVTDSILDKVDIDGNMFLKSFRDLWSTLISVATDRNAGEIVCIIDALDECHDSERSLLIEAVKDFYSLDSDKLALKFLMTSRPYHHIRNEFRELESRLPTIHLSGEAEHEVEEISREIDLVIDSRVDEISTQKALEPAEGTFLKEQLKSQPNRTYLWVTLTLEVVKSTPGFTKGNVHRVITTIPHSVDEAYERILEKSPDFEKARTFLSIVTAAFRPLSIEEMSHFMAIEESHKTEEDLMQDIEPEGRFKETLRDICGLFVVVIDTKIYLLHQTAREFLVRGDISTLSKDPYPCISPHGKYSWKKSLAVPESNKILARKCILYLSLDFVAMDIRRTLSLNYSTHFWFEHFKRANMEDERNTIVLARRLCDPESKPYATWNYNWRILHPTFPKPSDALWTASYLGLDKVVELLLAEGAQVNGNRGETNALWIASQYGHEKVVKLLLDAGAQVDLKDPMKWNKWNQTPLWVASNQGNTAVVELLLHAGAQGDVKETRSGETPLYTAVDHGHAAIVKLLLASGVQVDLKSDRLGATPLMIAACLGNETIVKLLLNAGAQVNVKDYWESTPLHYASESGREAIVKMLLDAGAQVTQKRRPSSIFREGVPWAAHSDPSIVWGEY